MAAGEDLVETNQPLEIEPHPRLVTKRISHTSSSHILLFRVSRHTSRNFNYSNFVASPAASLDDNHNFTIPSSRVSPTLPKHG